jgi:hypothetical protein
MIPCAGLPVRWEVLRRGGPRLTQDPKRCLKGFVGSPELRWILLEPAFVQIATTFRPGIILHREECEK